MRYRLEQLQTSSFGSQLNSEHTQGQWNQLGSGGEGGIQSR